MTDSSWLLETSSAEKKYKKVKVKKKIRETIEGQTPVKRLTVPSSV
jgi:hypothetical protein